MKTNLEIYNELDQILDGVLSKHRTIGLRKTYDGAGKQYFLFTKKNNEDELYTLYKQMEEVDVQSAEYQKLTMQRKSLIDETENIAKIIAAYDSMSERISFYFQTKNEQQNQEFSFKKEEDISPFLIHLESFITK
ncbi:hypothetical protein [Bacillus cereus group sp. TH228LC]|uniref:hypothetical protein n=1 Tax=Bacillus cereus group sp. TH228LC TaxID=3018049 RepID=UPI0022DF2EA5|nr:hypothetical protein [Bacillus cereus group sp. TH228LC]MDA1581939.1 hypothetical protein [Bacillus cereus group sp. TH228LC]